VAQFHWDPDAYLALMAEEVPAYARLEDALADAGVPAARMLELGTGTGQTARLPECPFGLVFSALAVHHLDAAGKADLFARVADVLRPRGRFVLADVVVPEDPADGVTPIDDGYDMPSRVDEQLSWLRAAGLSAAVAWSEGDLAVLVADRPGG
jgi:tRNA (cmo5U34)-methyltransferase